MTGDFALGNDLVFLPQFKDSFNPSFSRRVYTQEELSYCASFQEPFLRYASTFAAKESVYKAIKQLFPDAPLPWKKICITRHKAQGRPLVSLPDLYQDCRVSLTLSHDGDYVWAITFVHLAPIGVSHGQ